MKLLMKPLFTICLLFVAVVAAHAQHPCLLVTWQEIQQLRADRGQVAEFDKTIDQLLADADKACAEPISVPVPADGGGGPIHEKHKQNYYDMMHCGLAYQYTGNKKYADHCAQMLKAYAKLYPTLGLHPLKLSGTRGRLFWQTLNESVFLLHTAVAYDCVRETLTAKERKNIEDNLLFNMADFIMNGYKDYTVNHERFNRMHNHATWATAAVGMTGLATDNKDLVEKALYGTDKTGQHGGFLQQMDKLFSADGYYTEGAYYERYAIWPFVVFAQCLDHTMPELDIFHRRNSILRKALDALIQMSYDGEFFHFNDALQKGLSSQELTYATDIMYGKFPESKAYLYVAHHFQSGVLPIMGGYMVARDIQAGEEKPVVYESRMMHDGAEGNEGGVGIMRSVGKNYNSAVTVKATSHGMEHGHFDKLTMAYYDNGHEILSDYGASRFINIEAKNEGHYTKENNQYAKQTIAHNTVTVDETSNYKGKTAVANQHHADVLTYSFGDSLFQYVTVADTTAYPGVTMLRTVALATVPGLRQPLIIDVYSVKSSQPHLYDYNFWYNGTFVSTSFPLQRNTTKLEPLGSKNGYQYIWLDAQGSNPEGGRAAFTFYNDNRFYTINTAADPADELCMLELGANDPNYNLRDRKAMLLRSRNQTNRVFASAIETHGEYDLVMETSADLKSSCTQWNVVEAGNDRATVSGVFAGNTVTLTVNLTDGQATLNINKNK